MSRFLVLGGTGAMGVDLVKILLQKNNYVDVTTRSNKVSDNGNLKYLIGNAHDTQFLNQVLVNNYDAIIDFMVYTTKEFTERMHLFLKATKQYVFFSSARVYANSETLITEKSSRLLDCSNDKEFLLTDEYSLAKARQENLLIQSGQVNWTIVRPYITYNTERLQLGVLEKEYWLYRAIKGKKIIFFKDLADKITTLTYGYDVSSLISSLLCNDKSLGEIYHITANCTIKWADVLEVYLNTLEKILGKRPSVFLLENTIAVENVTHNKYQIIYDRLYDRIFDNKKLLNTLKTEYDFTQPELGLEKCLSDFLLNKHSFKRVSMRWEAYADRLTDEKTPLNEIVGFKQKLIYFVFRYFIKQ